MKPTPPSPRWYVPASVLLPDRLQRYAVYDCFADPDGDGFSIIAIDYPDRPYRPLPVRVTRGAGPARTIAPDSIERTPTLASPVLAHYPLADAADATLEIEVDGTVYPLVVNRAPAAPKPIGTALSTMFLHDHFLLPVWLDHYRKLGVDFFLLYYNGPRAELDRALAPMDSFDFSDCLFVEWPMSKALNEAIGLLSRKPRPNRKRWVHHAQPQEMLHALRLFGDHWNIEWLAIFDLDEYLHFTPAATLPGFVERFVGADVFLFECRWAEDRGDFAGKGAPPKYGFVDVYADSGTCGPRSRTKYVGRAAKMRIPEIHFPSLVTEGARMLLVPPSRASFLHFHHFTQNRGGRFPDREMWAKVETFA